jgi:lysozyme
VRPLTATFLVALLLELLMPRTLNAATLLLNASTEQTRLVPYDDARPNYVLKPGDKIIGTLTVGRGHTGPDVHIGDTWTMERVLATQISDLAGAEDAVQAALDEGHVAMTDNQFGATTDFVFNCGAGEFARSTARKLIVAGKLDAVPAEFQRFIYSKGKKERGLVTRRAKESLLYDTPDTATITLPPVTEPSITPDPVGTQRVWSSKAVIGACVAGVSTVCSYAPDLGHTLSETASQLQPLADYGHALKLAFLGCSLGGIVLGGVSGFLHHQKDASQ